MAPTYTKMATGQAPAPAVAEYQLAAVVLPAEERVSRVELIFCFKALLAPLGYNFPATGILTDASKLTAVHDLISSYWSSSSDWQAFKATDAYRRAAPAFERFATLGGRFLPPLVPEGLLAEGQGSSTDPTLSEWLSDFFEPPAAPAPTPPPPPIPPGAAAPGVLPPVAAAAAVLPSGAAAAGVDTSRLPRWSRNHPRVKQIQTEAQLTALSKRQTPLAAMVVTQPQSAVPFHILEHRVCNYQQLGRDGASSASLQRGAASALRLVTQLEAPGANATLQQSAALEGFRKCLIFVLWSIAERLHKLDPPLCTAPFGFGSPSFAFHDQRRAFCRDDIRALMSYMTDQFTQACQVLNRPTLDVRLLPTGLPADSESISARLVHAYIIFAAFSDDDIQKAWTALREEQPEAFPSFFHEPSHPKRTPWASLNRAPTPSQFIPAAAPYSAVPQYPHFHTPQAGYFTPPPLLHGGRGGPPLHMTQNICFNCGDHGHKSNKCQQPPTTDPRRLASIAAAKGRVAAHAAKRRASPASGASGAKRRK